MSHPLTTSTTLLRELAADSQHARWGEFVTRYEPMMRDYLRVRFPTVDANDVVAETLVALVDVLADYRQSLFLKVQREEDSEGVLSLSIQLFPVVSADSGIWSFC